MNDNGPVTVTPDYEVRLEIFQGPLDLLLHLIRKNEVDIFDIPIATIADQYLEYLDMMKALNINVAGDFLVMASTLLHIKSRLLLPHLEEDEEEDPRVEITRPLLEYLRLKEMAGELLERELLDRDVFARRLSPEYTVQLESEEPLLDVNLFQLMDAFKRILDERLPGVPLRLEFEKWSLKDKTSYILERLKNEGSIYFRDLFTEDKTISEFIVTFLALLELVHMGMIRVFQPDPGKDIRLKALFEDNEDD
ncbi:MAG: segregation/condensation protein A [Deltaproteobacteria bacterium]|nr:MAG: segregation/condensation protein A [Deltaproteobacteria bacterium]